MKYRSNAYLDSGSGGRADTVAVRSNRCLISGCREHEQTDSSRAKEGKASKQMFPFHIRWL